MPEVIETWRRENPGEDYAHGQIWTQASAGDNGAHDWRPAPVGAASLAEAVTDLVAAGASLLGGCCRVGSTEIRQLRASILRATSGSSGQ